MSDTDQLTVHRACLELRGPTSYGLQTCSCQPPVRWKGCDVSSVAELCLVCARGTAGGVTRWSWLGCWSCRALEIEMRRWSGIPVLPLGRHSIMNGVAHRTAQRDEESVVAFLTSLTGLTRSWERLRSWGMAEAARLLSEHPDDAVDIPLTAWQHAFPAGPAASVDAYERLLGVAVPSALREALSRSASA